MPSPSRAIAGWCLALAAALLLSRLWFLGHRSFDIDEFEHAHAAWTLAQGSLPYRDFFEHHTPGLYLAFAPLLARLRPETGVGAAVRALTLCRLGMWVLTVAAGALTYTAGARWRGRATGAVAALALVTSIQFVDSMLEFRPDVPAVCAVTLAVACALESARAERDTPRTAWALVSGLALGAALMCTQKALFAAPGLFLAIAMQRRMRDIVAFAAGTAIPVVAVAAWFAGRGALAPFYYYNVTMNGRLNGDRMSPFPRLWSSIARNPPLYALGAAGLIRGVRGRRRADTALVATAVSLSIGLVVIGKPWDQYYALLLPLLALLAADEALSLLVRTRRQPAVAAAGLAVVVLLATVNLWTSFHSNAGQIAELTYVMEHTGPADTVLSGTVGGGVFRPHAWFYFFLVGPFASDREYAALVAALESGTIRPRIVLLDSFLAKAPPPLPAFVRTHYVHVRDDIYRSR